MCVSRRRARLTVPVVLSTLQTMKVRAAVLFPAMALTASWSCAPTTLKDGPIRFSASDGGHGPAGFTQALTGGGGPVSWVVRDDPGAPGGGPVIVQASTDDTSYRFPLCVYDGAELADAAATVDFKSISGTVDQAAGLVLRYRPENYYVARANALEDNVNLFKTINGNRLKIAEVPVKVSPGQWHTLGFAAKGPHLTVTFNGKTVIKADDATFKDAGKVGLWTKADSVTAFANLNIGPTQ